MSSELIERPEPPARQSRRLLPRLPRLPRAKTWKGAIAVGIARFLIVVALLAGLAAAVALLVLWLTDMSPTRAFTLAFIGLGAFIILGGFLSSGGDMGSWDYYDANERESRFSSSFVYAAVGAALLVAGLMIDGLA
jgi:hypothetical protein